MAIKKNQKLKNKRILITAGPTWVAIDSVRAITNIATGQTGRILARLAKGKGAKVTLLLSSAVKSEEIKGVRIKFFRFFDELYSLLKREIKRQRFDCIIHNAAISDFLVNKTSKQKIASNRKRVNLKLVRAPKIINQIRRKCPQALLVMFKLEAGVSKAELIRRARIASNAAGADIVVANTFNGKRLQSFIYNHKQLLAKAGSRRLMARKLISILEERI